MPDTNSAIAVQAALARMHRAERIRELAGVARGCIIEIGRELISASDEIPRGDWLLWLVQEFGWSDETARKYMRVAEAFQVQPGLTGFEGITINATALYALSADGVPQSARDAAIASAQAGETVTKADAQRMVDDATAKAVADAIEDEREATAAKIAEAERQLADMPEQIRLAEERVRDADADAIEEASQTLDRMEEVNALLTKQLGDLRADQDKPADEQVLGLIRKLSKRRPSRAMLVTLASLLGRPITHDGETYEPASDEDLVAARHQRAASAGEAREMEASARWSGVLRALQAVNALGPVEDLFAQRSSRLDHLLVKELQQATLWINEFAGRMADAGKAETKPRNNGQPARKGKPNMRGAQKRIR